MKEHLSTRIPARYVLHTRRYLTTHGERNSVTTGARNHSTHTVELKSSLQNSRATMEAQRHLAAMSNYGAVGGRPLLNLAELFCHRRRHRQLSGRQHPRRRPWRPNTP